MCNFFPNDSDICETRSPNVAVENDSCHPGCKSSTGARVWLPSVYKNVKLYQYTSGYMTENSN